MILYYSDNQSLINT